LIELIFQQCGSRTFAGTRHACIASFFLGLPMPLREVTLKQLYAFRRSEPQFDLANVGCRVGRPFSGILYSSGFARIARVERE
jgi:hypothetical protein